MYFSPDGKTLRGAWVRRGERGWFVDVLSSTDKRPVTVFEEFWYYVSAAEVDRYDQLLKLIEENEELLARNNELKAQLTESQVELDAVTEYYAKQARTIIDGIRQVGSLYRVIEERDEEIRNLKRDIAELKLEVQEEQTRAEEAASLLEDAREELKKERAVAKVVTIPMPCKCPCHNKRNYEWYVPPPYTFPNT